MSQPSYAHPIRGSYIIPTHKTPPHCHETTSSALLPLLALGGGVFQVGVAAVVEYEPGAGTLVDEFAGVGEFAGADADVETETQFAEELHPLHELRIE